MTDQTPQTQGDNFQALSADQAAREAMQGTFKAISEFARVSMVEASVALLDATITTLRRIDPNAVWDIMQDHQEAIANGDVVASRLSNEAHQDGIARLKVSIQKTSSQLGDAHHG